MNFSDDLKHIFHLDKDKPADDGTEVLAAIGDAAAGASPAAAPQTPTPAAQGRVLLIHGYYVTLNNEVTIKDLGEAFDRALRMTKFASDIPGDAWTFDAVVHSTGMLVLRQWLTSDPFPPSDARSRIRRLKAPRPRTFFFSTYA